MVRVFPADELKRISTIEFPCGSETDVTVVITAPKSESQTRGKTASQTLFSKENFVAGGFREYVHQISKYKNVMLPLISE